MEIAMITDQRIETYIQSLGQELPEILKSIEQEALVDYVPIIKKPTQNLLRMLLRCNRPKQILEVGTAVGFSAILMSEYLDKESQITTIEKMPSRIEKAKKNFTKTNKQDQITLLEGDAIEVLKVLVMERKKFDFIFMDAAKGQYLHFLPDMIALLNVGGLLLSDNVLQDGDIVESRYAVTRRNRTIHSRMREYLFQLTHHAQLDTIVMPIGDGVTISLRID